MVRKRDPHRDEQIERLLLGGTPSKVICDKLGVSPATLSRRRQELKISAIQSRKQYERHQEQLVAVAQGLRECVRLPEPAFVYIEHLQQQVRPLEPAFAFNEASKARPSPIRSIEWEMRGGKPFLSVPRDIRESECHFFGREVEAFPCFQAHTKGTQLPTQFDLWSQRGGEYIGECHRRLAEIRQKVSADKPESIPLARETSEVIDGVVKDLTPPICVLPMFWWTIYSYPLRPHWAESEVKYERTTDAKNGIDLVCVSCDVDKCSPTPIFRVSSDHLECLLRLHQKLLKAYKLVESLQKKYQETAEIAEGIGKALSIYTAQELIRGSCPLCVDWVKRQRLSS
jgi:hypothetical protein